MSLNASDLADKLWSGLSTKGSAPVSDNIKNYAAGLIAACKAAIVSNLPGTVIAASCPPGSALDGGQAMGGLAILQPSTMSAQAAVGLQGAGIANMMSENSAIISYIMTGLINFAAGNITGQCTNTPPPPNVPGPLTNGAGTNGQITGLTGSGAMGMVAAALGSTGPDMNAFYTTLIDYLLSNAAVTYPANRVVGSCTSGGLLLGAATGGTIA